LAVSNVAFLPPHDERVPMRDPYLHDDTWLVSLVARDALLIPLVRHLHAIHNIVTVAEFDAAGWTTVNTYPGRLPPDKLRKFLQRIGRKRNAAGPAIPEGRARVLAFRAAQP
jgi:hypothetical protein